MGKKSINPIKLLGTVFTIYGALFLFILFISESNLNFLPLDILSMALSGLFMLSLFFWGKFIMFFSGICLVTSGTGMIRQKKWGIKLAICFCSLSVLFLIYLSVGIMQSMYVGRQTTASLATAIVVYFLPFLYVLICLLTQERNKKLYFGLGIIFSKQILWNIFLLGKGYDLNFPKEFIEIIIRLIPEILIFLVIFSLLKNFKLESI
jgi:hypothetical protein